ncbi:MAG: hypothetical protein IPK08_15070 [Bacteroidetes bacterium]|nr:hypothetical protein [Bacteroidota bacterium]
MLNFPEEDPLEPTIGGNTHQLVILLQLRFSPPAIQVPAQVTVFCFLPIRAIAISGNETAQRSVELLLKIIYAKLSGDYTCVISNAGVVH